MKVNNKVSSPMKPQKNFLGTIILGISLFATLGVVWFVLSTVLATEPYYVLAQDVPAKTQVTEFMLKKIDTSKGTAPQNAINIETVKQGTVFTRYPLNAGDVLSLTNTGLDLDTSAGIPDDWGVTSFTINVDNAVGGNILKGDYFDVLATNEEGESKYLFFNLLALDVNLGNTDTAVDNQGNVVPLGQTIQFVVGLPNDQIALLHSAISSYEKINLVVAPKLTTYESRTTDNLNGIYKFTQTTKPANLIEGTDNSFTTVLRDTKGRPVTKEACDAGLINPSDLCANIPDNMPSKKSNHKVQPAQPIEQSKPEQPKSEQSSEKSEESSSEESSSN